MAGRVFLMFDANTGHPFMPGENLNKPHQRTPPEIKKIGRKRENRKSVTNRVPYAFSSFPFFCQLNVQYFCPIIIHKLSGFHILELFGYIDYSFFFLFFWKFIKSNYLELRKVASLEEIIES